MKTERRKTNTSKTTLEGGVQMASMYDAAVNLMKVAWNHDSKGTFFNLAESMAAAMLLALEEVEHTRTGTQTSKQKLIEDTKSGLRRRLVRHHEEEEGLAVVTALGQTTPRRIEQIFLGS